MLSPDYGRTAGLAHCLIVLALTAASRPVLVDGEGRVWGIPRRRIVSVVSRAAGETGLT